jgi:hypothetical protein
MRSTRQGWSAIPAAGGFPHRAGVGQGARVVAVQADRIHGQADAGPEADLTSPEAAIDTAWRAAASGSVMTASGRVRARSVPSSS